MEPLNIVTIADDGAYVLHLKSENLFPFYSMSDLVNYLKAKSIDATLADV